MLKILKPLSGVMDLVSNSVVSHHKKVTYIAYRIGKEMNLDLRDLRNLVIAANIHDIGVFYIRDVELSDFSFDDEENAHALIGYYLLSESPHLEEISLFIKYHHSDFNDYNSRISPVYNLLHLSDQLAFLTEEYDIYNDYEKISREIEEGSGTKYWPEAVKAFQKLIRKEYFCLDIKSSAAIDRELDKLVSSFESKIRITIEKVLEITRIISYIIDFRSPFTATHSVGVSAVAKELSRLLGFTKKEQMIIEAAGYLHDIGKLVIPPEILNKKGKLDEAEWRKIRSHTYYTYQVLEYIDEFPCLKEWAAYHHERLDGTGYPFHLKAEDLSQGARIMAVADIFTAVTEDRPYRACMDRNQVYGVFQELVKGGKIDENIVKTLLSNYDLINAIRKKRQLEGRKYYQSFKNKRGKNLRYFDSEINIS